MARKSFITGYADTGTNPNLRFTFKVHNRSIAEGCIKRLEKKNWTIKAAWYLVIMNGIRHTNIRLK